MAPNVDRLITNNTPLEARAFHQFDHRGHDVITAVAKLAWRVKPNGEAALAVPQRPIRIASDRHDPMNPRSSMRFPDDRVPVKPGTDVIMLANVVPPEGSLHNSLDVSFRLETGTRTISKAVRVFGPRVFMKSGLGVKPGPSQPLTQMPITYELAEGGVDPSHPDVIDQDNHSGIGCRKDSAALLGQEAYRIEPLGGSKPAGFGAIDPSWAARRKFRGTSDDQHLRERYPLMPKDFDPRHYCSAHPDLRSEQPLNGDEPIEIIGATPEAAFRFKLPRYKPCFTVTVFGESSEAETHLDTMIVDLTNLQRRIVELTWRVSVRLPRRSEHLQGVKLTNGIELDEPVFQQLMKDLAEAKKNAPS